MLTLVPVVEIYTRDVYFDWAPMPEEWAHVDPPFVWARLSAQMPDSHVAQIVATLAEYNNLPSLNSPKKVMKAIEQAEGLILSGGLMVQSGDRTIAPSCCCGLENWREWFDVRPGGSSPWLGHDPSPFVEMCEDCAVIWSDGGDLGEKESVPGAFGVRATYPELAAALERASADLRGFVGRLSEWFDQNMPRNAWLSPRFAEIFQIR